MFFVCIIHSMITKDLYKIQSKDKDKITIKLADANHSLFKAHFPSEPILPAFIHFEIITDIFNLEIKIIKKAKFMQIIGPEQELTYKRKNNSFSVLCNNKEIANIQI